MNLPIIRITIDEMRTQICTMLSERQVEIDACVNGALAAAVAPVGE